EIRDVNRSPALSDHILEEESELLPTSCGQTVRSEDEVRMEPSAPHRHRSILTAWAASGCAAASTASFSTYLRNRQSPPSLASIPSLSNLSIIVRRVSALSPGKEPNMLLARSVSHSLS